MALLGKHQGAVKGLEEGRTYQDVIFQAAQRDRSSSDALGKPSDQMGKNWEAQ